MSAYSKDFEDFKDKIWLNAASEGPLPKVSAQSLQESISQKSLPYQLDIPKFISVPAELKKSIGQLIGVASKDVILANSASYGIHLLADGISWKVGDEIIVMQNDFPTDILPWLALERQGVKIIQVPAKNFVMTPEELENHITPKTKLFCISHVHTFTGLVLDIEAFSKICQDKGVLFVLNISQSVGNIPIDISKFSVDAVVAAGYKWLCGPYGTGFAWMTPELRDALNINRAYWPTVLSEAQLQNEGDLKFNDSNTARKFDIFGTANFFNFVPFKSSIDYFLDIGIEAVWKYNNSLIDHLINGLDNLQYELVSPKQGPARSCLIVLSHKDKSKNLHVFGQLKDQGIYAAFWKGNIRFSPHIYNSFQQIDKALSVLESAQKV